jgi:hypothetical protein
MTATQETLTGRPGPTPGSFQSDDGRVLTPPATWALLPPGDAALTRRVKAAGPHWIMQERRGRKLFSRGIWADAQTIARLRDHRADEKDDPAWQARQDAARKRREIDQERYVETFHDAVLAFLAFHQRHAEVARRLAAAITAHATPVGSGTVARATRLELPRKAEAATIAWMRHQTTAYDRMQIQRVKGYRREVRRKLAEQSRRVLNRYRLDQDVDPATCPLYEALVFSEENKSPGPSS